MNTTPAPSVSTAPEATSAATRPSCERCEKPLTGRQKRFCTDRCRNDWWQEAHPRLNFPPLEPGQSRQRICDRILAQMMDREWYTDRECPWRWACSSPL